ncbi:MULTISPECIES: hypothetical protein [Streptomyces]|uniref:hypothetical protein n=1 Tax=Streptomyces lycopersici TaxID=2974589 RepID=UPI0021CE4259|nr:hypothetical protein [Streptomyces sp. NEAU-383]
MSNIVQTIKRVRVYVDAMGPDRIDMTDAKQLSAQLTAANNLLTELDKVFSKSTKDGARTGEQDKTIKAVRAHVAQGVPSIKPTEVGRLVGHLMTAEVLLMEVAKAFQGVR